ELEFPIVIATLGVLFLFYALAVRAFFRARGFQTLKPSRLENFFQALRAQRVPAGLKIFKTSDEFWQNHVRLCLERCDAVLLDITELSENVLWEARAAYAGRPADEIILCCLALGGDGEEQTQSKRNTLAAALADGACLNSPMLAYRPSWRGSEQKAA